MSDWKQAQQQQWNSSADVSDDYTDEEYTDDEYEPIEATAWGSQSIAADGSTNVSLSMSGWQSLIDPNIKTKAGGIGSGQLHRRGANYQPVDEQAIIDRRLGKPIPKGGLGGSKKKKSRKPKAGGAPPPAAAPRRPVPNSMTPPSSSAYRGREAITTGPWGSAQLSSTPFWEQPANKAGHGSMASKYASAPPANIATSIAQPQAAAPARAAAPAPAPVKQQQQQQQQQFRQPEPAAPAVAPSRPIAQPKPPSSFRTSQGSAASKYASPSSPAPSAYNQPPPQPQQQPPTQYQQQPLQPIYQQNNELPTVSLKLEQPIINLKIELNHGVYASLPVYANEPSVNAVKRLEKEYHLHLDQYHQDNVKQFIEYHVQQYNERQQQQNQA
ncbi:unnamed protein product [Mucor circinelloides]